jgi:hypothetical protein
VRDKNEKNILNGRDEIVSSKWIVDYPDGSVNEFELMCKAVSLGFTEIHFGTWTKQ